MKEIETASPYPFSIPILDRDIYKSSRYLSELYIITIPVYTARTLCKVFNRLKIKPPSAKLLNYYVPRMLVDFAMCVDNYAMLVYYSQCCCEIFREMNGFSHPLESIINKLEELEPALDEAVGERLYISVETEKFKYPTLVCSPIDIAISSWKDFMARFLTHTLVYEKGAKLPSFFENVRVSEDAKIQYSRILEVAKKNIY